MPMFVIAGGMLVLVDPVTQAQVVQRMPGQEGRLIQGPVVAAMTVLEVQNMAAQEGLRTAGLGGQDMTDQGALLILVPEDPPILALEDPVMTVLEDPVIAALAEGLVAPMYAGKSGSKIKQKQEETDMKHLPLILAMLLSGPALAEVGRWPGESEFLDIVKQCSNQL